MPARPTTAPEVTSVLLHGRALSPRLCVLTALLATAPAPAAQPASSDPVADMTLEQKIGQLFLISIVGRQAPSESSARVLREVPVGGIILFSYNLRGGPQGIARLTAALQEIARTSGARVPYFIAVDQEGGRVQRLRRGFTRVPAPRALAPLSHEALEQLAHAIARQLLAVGVNLNLAPVVESSAGEADVIGDRSFAPSSEQAAPRAAAFIAGTQAAGVLATAKHFPGNAASDVDPHRAMPRLTLSREQLEATLLPPFASAVRAGVDAVMLSHVEIPALDAERPVALSREVVHGLLRERLAFDGLICSDDLLMGAVTEKFEPAEAAILAIIAGTDLLMVSSPNAVLDLHRAVVAAVRAGRIPKARIDGAARRVLRAKRRRDLWTSADRLRGGETLRGLARARRDAERLLAPLVVEPARP